MELTISKALSVEKVLRQRINELKSLRTESSAVERNFFGGDRETKKEPTYDIKSVDTKLVSLEKALFEIDSTIKEANAKTKITADVNLDDILSPLS